MDTTDVLAGIAAATAFVVVVSPAVTTFMALIKNWRRSRAAT